VSDFEVIKIIGRGGFSKVFQVRKRSNGMLYAMKVINKRIAGERSKIQKIMLEKSILAKIEHPFIVKLHYYFQSVNLSNNVEKLSILDIRFLSCR